VPGVWDAPAESHVVELVVGAVEQVEQAQVIGNAERADRVPHADEADGNRTVALVVVAEGQTVSPTAVVRSLLAFSVTPVDSDDGRVDIRDVRRVDQSAAADHSGQAARGVRATTEPEQRDDVTRLVLLGQPPVGLPDVRGEAHAG
jgi:hypothetical protein